MQYCSSLDCLPRSLALPGATGRPTRCGSSRSIRPSGWAHLPAGVGKPSTVISPEAERRQLDERPLDPTIRKAIVEDNNVRPDYARIHVPVLAVYRTVTMEQALKDFPPRDSQERTALNQAYTAGRAMLSKWQRDLLAGVPTARIVELPGANVYMFVSNEADIIREVRAFAATLK
jgi:pimeloyl-ACP methyl ester carboxylesterase